MGTPLLARLSAAGPIAGGLFAYSQGAASCYCGGLLVCLLLHK